MHGTLPNFDIENGLALLTETEAGQRPSREAAEEAVRTLIRWAGDDPGREGLVDTPARVARAYAEWFAGYDQDPADILQRTRRRMPAWQAVACASTGSRW